MNGPTTKPEQELLPALTAEQQAAQQVIDRQDYVKMLTECLPTLRSEYLAALYMMAELTKQGDVQVKKRTFMKAAGKIIGGIPPMTEAALHAIISGKEVH